MRALHTAYIVRVRKGLAGDVVPFDKVYFFHRNDEKHIPRVFKDAMVFPVTKRFASAFDKVLDESISSSEFSFTRNGENNPGDYPPRLKEKLKKPADYVAVVPVLFARYSYKLKKKLDNARKTFPMYLTAVPGKSPSMVKALSARAYFLLDGVAMRPICLACRRHHDYLQGFCIPGELQCYENLARTKPADLVAGVKRYHDLQPEAKEPLLNLGGN